MLKNYTFDDFVTHASAVIALASMVYLWKTDDPGFLLTSCAAAGLCLYAGIRRPRRPRVD